MIGDGGAKIFVRSYTNQILARALPPTKLALGSFFFREFMAEITAAWAIAEFYQSLDIASSKRKIKVKQ